MKIEITLIVFILGCSNGLTVNKTSCPDVKSVDNFRLNSFAQGLWHTFGRYPNEIEKNENTVAYKGFHKKGYYYKLKMFGISENSPEFIESEFSLDQNYSETGDVISKISYGKPMITENLKIKFLLYDSKKYAVMYSCKYDQTEDVINEYVWILLRSRNPNAEVKETIEEFIKTSKILDFNEFEWLNLNTSCRKKQNKIQ